MNTFNRARPETLGDGFKYYIVLLFIYSAIISVIVLAIMLATAAVVPFVGAFFARFGTAMAGMVFVTVLVGGIISVLIGGAWLHLWAYIFGGRKGITQTWKACMYGATPIFIIGWLAVIPYPFVGVVIGLIAGIWALIVTIIGVRQLHEISTGRAIAAVLLPMFIVGIIMVMSALLYARATTMAPP